MVLVQEVSHQHGVPYRADRRSITPKPSLVEVSVVEHRTGETELRDLGEVLRPPHQDIILIVCSKGNAKDATLAYRKRCGLDVTDDGSSRLQVGSHLLKTIAQQYLHGGLLLEFQSGIRL